MFKSIFLLFISVIGLPVYVLCVALCLAFGAVFGLSYQDSCVYVCEYGQPIVTVWFALLFLWLCVRRIRAAMRSTGLKVGIMVLAAICLSYAGIAVYCCRELLERQDTYEGMTNSEIYRYVVHKLFLMGSAYPQVTIQVFTGDVVTYGYVMANIEVYLMPLSLVLLLGVIQWRVGKSLRGMR